METEENFKVISSTEHHDNFIETSVALVKDKCNWTYHELVNRSLGNQQIKVKLDSLENGLIDLINVSINYNFSQTPVNGFSGFVDLIVQFFSHLSRTNYLTLIESTEDLESVIELFLNDIQLLKNFHDKKLMRMKENDNFELISEDKDEFKQFLLLHQADSKLMEIMVSNFLGFWNNQVTAKALKFNELSSAYSFMPFPKCFKVFRDEKLRRLAFYKASLTFHPIASMTFFDGHLGRQLFRRINRDSRVTSKTLLIERQSRWAIALRGRDVFESHLPTTDKSPLRCRYHEHKKCKNEDGTLVFHCHGGGFVVTRAEFHESYLKKWVGDLENISILCLDYSLRAPNPIVFQEFLDAYLWATSRSPDVIDKLGFHPKKIIVTGDSAGGIIGMALVNCISIIQSKDPLTWIPYPSDLIFFYGAFICSGYALPSRIKMFYDEMLSLGLLLNSVGCITDTQGALRPKPRSTNKISRTAKYVWEDLQNMCCKSKFPNPWFIKEGKFDVDRILSTQSMLEDTFFNSLENVDYDKLDKIRLTLMTTNRCVFLDDNIELAKAWKGPVEMHTVVGAMHGFLLIPEEKDVYRFAVNLLQKALTKPSIILKT